MILDRRAEAFLNSQLGIDPSSNVVLSRTDGFDECSHRFIKKWLVVLKRLASQMQHPESGFNHRPHHSRFHVSR